MAQLRRHPPHFFFFFFLAAVAASCVLSSPPLQLASLLAFKSAVEQDPLQLLLTWNPLDLDAPCRWTGITCSPNASVVSVALPKAQLSASFPAAAAALAALPHLRHLNLHHNKFRGAIPPSLFNATQLQSLFLFDNLLTGEIPAEISRLAALQSFSAARNSLSGPLPPLFPSSLRYLDLSHNSLSGAISASFADNLPLLNVSLDLSFNNLSGAIPPSFAHLPPSTFLGNPSLCGYPLATSCGASSPPSPPVVVGHVAARLSRRAVVAIVTADAAAVCLICLAVLCCCCCWRRSSTTSEAEWVKSPPSPPHKSDTLQISASNPRTGGGGRSEGNKRAAAGCAGAPASPMEGVYGELVALGEERLDFNLEELLKASAYVLGKGRMGIVYRVSLSEHLTVAVRRLGDKGAHRYSEFKREVEKIGGLRHPNIVRLKAYYWASDEKLLVYDFIPNGNLAAALRGSSQASIARIRIRLKIARGAARGLAFLHSNGGAHGDVRAGNVLLDDQMEAYIGDYGLTKLLSIVGSGVPSFIADAGEAVPAPPGKKASASSRSSAGASDDSEASDVAPAASARQPHKNGRKASATVYPPPGTAGQKEDVYGLGLILLELVTGGGEEGATPPWLLHVGATEVVEEAMRRGRLKSGALEGLLEVARACLAVKPERRPSMAEVCRSLDAISDTA